jgi:hypothetical protein
MGLMDRNVHSSRITCNYSETQLLQISSGMSLKIQAVSLMWFHGGQDINKSIKAL